LLRMGSAFRNPREAAKEGSYELMKREYRRRWEAGEDHDGLGGNDGEENRLARLEGNTVDNDSWGVGQALGKPHDRLRVDVTFSLRCPS